MVKKIKYIIPSLVYGLPLAVFAQAERGTQVVGSVEDVFLVINRVMNYFLSLVLLIAVIMMIYAGFSFMTAGGDSEKLATAKKSLTFAIIGIVVAVLAFSVKAVVMSILRA